MSRNVVLIAAILLVLSVLTTSGASAMPSPAVTILPKDCTIPVGEELPLVLNGSIPSNTVVRWDVDKGGVTSMLPGRNAIFVAPVEPTVVTISVSILSSVPGMDTSITRQCIVTSLNSAPRGVVQAIENNTPGTLLSFALENSTAN